MNLTDRAAQIRQESLDAYEARRDDIAEADRLDKKASTRARPAGKNRPAVEEVRVTTHTDALIAEGVRVPVSSKDAWMQAVQEAFDELNAKLG